MSPDENEKKCNFVIHPVPISLKKTAAFSFRCYVSGTEISPDEIE